jgi:hypothetical protein
MSEDPFSEMFEASAQMSEAAGANAAQSEQNLQVARELRDWLLDQPDLTSEQRASVAESLEALVAISRTQIAGFVTQADLASKALAFVDPGQPEHVGVVRAEAEAIDALARGLQALAAGMSLIQEAQRFLERKGGA